jgi:hypothetical protein
MADKEKERHLPLRREVKRRRSGEGSGWCDFGTARPDGVRRIL